MEIETQDKPMLWYAMSAPYGRELKAEEILTRENVECFIPKKRIETINSKKQRKVTYTPIVRNLLFVHTSEQTMRDLKSRMNELIQFKMCPMPSGAKVPVIVPDKQMEDFLRIYHSIPDKLIYLSPDDIGELCDNAKVVIADGLFKGIEGYYQRIAGKKHRHFIVKIENFMACATLLVDCDFVKRAE